MASVVVDAFRQMPPVSRTVAATAFFSSLGLYTGVIPSSLFGFHYSVLLKFPPQVWRFPLSFLVTAPSFGMLTDTYFLYKYLSDLEIGSSRFPRRGDLVWYLACVAVFTVMFTELLWRYTFISWGPHYTFLPGLLTAIVYTATQDARGQKATLWFFSVPAQTMPYCLVVMSCFSPGTIPLITVQIAGILAAHLWDFLTRLWPEFGGGRNLLPTPSFSRRIPAPGNMNFGAGLRGGPSTGTSTGVSTDGPLPESWRTRGAGRRLGGE